MAAAAPQLAPAWGRPQGFARATGLPFEERYGGTGTGALMVLVAIEELSKVCATTGLILAVQELGSLGIKLAGTDEQKARWLPRLASGEWLPAYALTANGSRLPSETSASSMWFA